MNLYRLYHKIPQKVVLRSILFFPKGHQREESLRVEELLFFLSKGATVEYTLLHLPSRDERLHVQYRVYKRVIQGNNFLLLERECVRVRECQSVDVHRD